MYGFDSSTVEWKVNTSPVTTPVVTVVHTIDAADATNHPVHPDGDKSNYFKDSFSHTWTSEGTFMVEIVESNPSCSSNVIKLTVYVHALPSGTLISSDADNAICIGDNVTFTASGGVNYNFKIDGGSVQNGSGSTFATTSLTNGQEVTVEVTNANGCVSTYAGITTAVHTLPSGTLTSSDLDNTICAGDNVTFTATGGTNYHFKVNGGSVQNGSGSTYSTTGLTNGQEVTVDVTNANGCVSTYAGITTVVNTLPTGTLTSSDSDNSICAGDNVTFTATGGTNYNFKVDGGSVQNGSGSTYSTTGLTNGQEVTVDVTNGNGCVATYAGITTTVLTSPLDAGDITGDAIVQSGQTGVIYRIPAVTHATNYEWEYSGTGANITNNGDEISVSFADNATSGELKVRGTNACGIGGYSELFSIYVVSPCETTIENWTFNTPVLTESWKVYSSVNGWNSTPHGIEIWRSGFLGITTPDGGQFCELNSNGANTMYQDIDVNAGAEMVWAITYRYRNSSSETIRLRIGPVGGNLTNVATISNDNGDAWVVHSGSYTVPSSLPGGKVRFQIETVSPSSSSGNLIDGIQFYSVDSDVEPPQFIKATLPANTIDLGGACELVLPDYTVGVDAIDNCDADLVITQNPAAGEKVFGGEKVVLTARDEAGNEATYEMDVLGDNISPTASNPAPLAVKCIGDVPLPNVNVVIDENDNCTAIPTVAWVSDSDNGGLGTTASPYIVTRIYSVTDDASNSINVSQTITAIDDVNPTITAPADFNVNADAGSCDASSVALGTPTTSDNCGVASVTNDAPTTFPLGNTTVTWTVTDNAGLTSSDTQIVTVIDNEKPTISCPGNITQTADAGSCGAIINYATPVGADNCAGASTVQTAGLASGSTFPIGTTTNTFEVTDAAGNKTSCSFDVTISDDEDPVIVNLPTDITVGACNNVTWTEPTATDNCSVTLTKTHNSGDVFPVGTTLVTYTATDATGNTDIRSFNVTVLPVVTISLSETSPILCNGGNADITITAGGGDGSYTYSKDGTNYQAASNVYSMPAGTHTLYVKDGDGCVAQTNITINEPTVLDVNIAADNNTICEGEPVVVTATVSGGVAAYTYEFYLNGTQLTSNANYTISGNQLTSSAFANGDEITVKVIDNNSCEKTSDKVVMTVRALPTPTITGDFSVCAEDPETPLDPELVNTEIYFTEAGMSNYTWTVTGGTIESGLGTNEITVKWKNAGTGIVSVNYENTNGCSATSAKSETITIYERPNPSSITTDF
ncbi:hypothetical protein DF185_20595 [Marinifilum breve]|uniref:HYR domain-containing protein n=2 Tax=Marinifilum breve TaxID=2184082 RepID=A0A2V3ZUP7_9BACT|nr:hypothetical protein DF185_20595 [Marinifilum breve]